MGALSVRRTKKNFSRTANDITLEQTANRDAASKKTGITAYTTNAAGRRCWCVTRATRSGIVSILSDMAGVTEKEECSQVCITILIQYVSIILCFLICALQIHWLNYHFLQECKLARITKDQNDIKSLILSITDTLNPFDSELDNNKLYSLMNGVALDPEIAAGLINFYSTGQRWMEEFIE